MIVIPQCSPAMPPLPPTPAAPPLTIAVLSPTSGELAPMGRNLRNGIQLALDEWNATAEQSQPRLAWALYHTDCTFDSGQQAARQAIAAGHTLMLGPICSETAIAAAIEAQTAQALLIAPAAPHPLVTVDAQGNTRPTVFRMVYTPDSQGQAAARFALDRLNLRRAALLRPANDPYAAWLADAFSARFAAEGGEIVQQTTFLAGQPDFAATTQIIEQADAGLVYFPGSAMLANQFTGQLNRAQPNSLMPKPVLLGSDIWHEDELVPVGTASFYFPVHFFPESDRPLVQRWRERYQATYAVEPDTLAALGYDAAAVLTRALQQSAAVDPAAIARAIEQISWEGVTGEISFDPGHNPRQPIPFMQLQPEGLNFAGVVGP